MSEIASLSLQIDEAVVGLVHDALERHSIIPENAIVVGGAVMGLYGIREPADVDALILPSRFQQIEAGPGIGLVYDKNHYTLQTTSRIAGEGLKLEMIYPFPVRITSPDEEDLLFKTMVASEQVICTSGIYHQTLEGVFNAKRQRVEGKWFPRRKDKDDYKKLSSIFVPND